MKGQRAIHTQIPPLFRIYAGQKKLRQHRGRWPDVDSQKLNAKEAKTAIL